MSDIHHPEQPASDVLDQPAKAPSKLVKGNKKKRYPKRSLPARIGIGILRIAVMVYVGFVIALVLMEERLVYPGAYHQGPDRGSATATDGVETVTFASTNDVTISARLLHREDASRIVLYFHGNGVKAKWSDRWIRQLSRALDATVLAAEYRGFEDEVTPTEKGVIEDCFAARDWLCDRYQCEPSDVILYGRSLGGGCAAAVASRGGAKALVMERTFDRLCDVAAAKYPFVPIQYLIKNRFDSVARLTVYDGPFLQVHGLPDQLIPIDHARRLFESVKAEPKQMIEVPGLEHIAPLPENVLADVARWIDQVAPSNENNTPNETAAPPEGETR